MADAIIITVLIGITYLVVKYLVKKLARKELSCGGSCASCPGVSLCHTESTTKQTNKRV